MTMVTIGKLSILVPGISEAEADVLGRDVKKYLHELAPGSVMSKNIASCRLTVPVSDKATKDDLAKHIAAHIWESLYR